MLKQICKIVVCLFVSVFLTTPAFSSDNAQIHKDDPSILARGGNGPGDGTGNGGDGPGDGTGNGAPDGAGDCPGAKMDSFPLFARNGNAGTGENGGFGPGDGTGNDGDGPADGTGNGAPEGAGDCPNA